MCKPLIISDIRASTVRGRITPVKKPGLAPRNYPEYFAGAFQ